MASGRLWSQYHSGPKCLTITLTGLFVFAWETSEPIFTLQTPSKNLRPLRGGHLWFLELEASAYTSFLNWLTAFLEIRACKGFNGCTFCAAHFPTGFSLHPSARLHSCTGPSAPVYPRRGACSSFCFLSGCTSCSWECSVSYAGGLSGSGIFFRHLTVLVE